MSTHNTVALTSDMLRPVNTLTRASPRRGFLDYSTYLQLLVRDGHVKSVHPASSAQAPAQPISSALQVVSSQDRTDGKTDFRADQALWSRDDLPHILYLTRPPSIWVKEEFLKDPLRKTYQIHGKYLRDIPILPDHIAPKLEGWRLQAWYCFDPRVKLADILARMGNTVNGSTVQMRSLRFRTDCPALGWANKGPKYDAEKLRIEGLLEDAGLDSDSRTTRDLAWGHADPDDEYSTRVDIPAKKGWNCSVEDATAVHLAPISSPGVSGPSNATQPALFPATTSNSRRRALPPVDEDSDATISDDEAGDIEEDLDTLNFDTTTHLKTHSGRKRKLFAPEESAARRRNTSEGFNPGLLSCWVPARGWESQPAPSFDHRQHTLNQDLSLSKYPPIEEVPRAPSIAFPLEYDQFLVNEPQITAVLQVSNNVMITDSHDAPRGVRYSLEDAGVIRIHILYGARRIGLKTPDERHNLSDETAQLLASFCPIGSEERFLQLEYLLDSEQAQFGFEDCNGQWGVTNWDFKNTHNVRYNISQEEARTLLAAGSRK